MLLQRSIPLRFLKEFRLMKTIALVLALAFAAPLAAHAQTQPSNAQHDQLVQKIQNTYHTSFPASGN
jgi:hypothetical protein